MCPLNHVDAVMYSCVHIHTIMRLGVCLVVLETIIVMVLHLLVSVAGWGQAGGVRPVFKSSILKNGPRPWDIWAFKGYVEMNINNGSRVWDPQFEIVRIEFMRTDRSVPFQGTVQHSRVSSWGCPGTVCCEKWMLHNTHISNTHRAVRLIKITVDTLTKHWYHYHINCLSEWTLTIFGKHLETNLGHIFPIVRSGVWM